MKPDKDQAIIDLVESEWELLQAAVDTLQLSIRKCQLIGIKRVIPLKNWNHSIH